MSKKLPSSINLLEPVNAPDDLWDQLYYWVINVGKYLFVFVEIVVLFVFASRFIIDKQNNDLTRDINDLVDDLSGDYYRKIDVKYTNLHELLADLRSTSEDQVINSKVIASVLDSLPSNIELISFSFSEGNVNMVFIANDFKSITEFEQLLNNNPAYGDVLLNLSKSGEVSSTIDFTVSFPIIYEKFLEDGLDSGLEEELEEIVQDEAEGDEVEGAEDQNTDN